jgi:carbonic anhydrase/acetyltransferase-like protein (isoleucine patch superfamily)
MDPQARGLMPLYAFDGNEPRVPDDAFVAPNATLVGAVELGAESSVWFGAVLRADFDRIVIGEGSCIQDNAVIHAAEGLPTMLEGCVVEDGAVISMGAIVLQRAHIGSGALVAAGSVVREGQVVPAGVVAAGVPAAVKKQVDGSSRRWIESAAAEYRQLRGRYLEELTVREETRW